MKLAKTKIFFSVTAVYAGHNTANMIIDSLWLYFEKVWLGKIKCLGASQYTILHLAL